MELWSVDLHVALENLHDVVRTSLAEDLNAWDKPPWRKRGSISTALRVSAHVMSISSFSGS